jgi:hypothetical protein
MMKQRTELISKPTSIGLALTVTVALLVGCSTSGGNKAETSPTETSTHAPERRLPYPGQTRFVAKFRFDRIYSAVEHVADSLRDADEHGDTEASKLPSARELSSFFIAGLLGADIEQQRLMPSLQGAATDKPLGPTFDSLALDRPSLVALSTQPNASMLDYFALSMPYTGADVLQPGVWLRFFVPARDGHASRLRDQIQNACQPVNVCRSIKRIDTYEQWVVIDGRFGPPAALALPEEGSSKDSPNKDARLTTDGAHVFEELTPAGRRFLEDDSAASLYARTDDIPAFGALMGAIDMRNALTSASPKNRTALAWRGFEIAGGAFQFQSPETRELGDFTVGLGRNEDAWQFHGVMSRTKVGSKVADAAKIERTLPDIQVDSPTFSLDWGFNVKRSLRATTLPAWAREASEDGSWGHLLELVRTGGLWPYATVLVSHPTGLLKTLHEMRADMPNRRAEQTISTATSINAIRAKFSVEQSSSAPAGYAPHGGIAIGYAGDPPLLNRIKRSEPLLRRMLGTEVTIDVESSEQTDHQLVRIGLGDTDGVFGESSDVDTGIRATLDLTPLSDIGQQTSIPGWSYFASQQALHLRTDGSNSALEFNVASGENPVALKPPSPSDPPLEQPAPANPCLDAATQISRQSMQNLGEAEHRSNAIGRTLTELKSTLNHCDSPNQNVTDSIRLIRSAWLDIQAGMQLAAVSPVKALESITEACQLRNTKTCTVRDRFATIAEQFLPPRTSGHLESEPLQAGSILIGQNDLFPVGESMRLPSTLDKPGRIAELVETGNPPGEREKQMLGDLLRTEVVTFDPVGSDQSHRLSATYVPIDGRRAWSVTKYLVSAGTDMNLTRRQRYEATIMGRNKPPKDISAALLPVTSDRTDFDSVSTLLLFAPGADAPDDAKRVQLVLSDEGISVNSTDIEFTRPGDCRGDQPDVCVRDSDRVEQLLEQLSDEPLNSDEASQLFDALAEQYRVDALQQAAGNHASAPLFFDVQAAPELPTGLVARVIAAVTHHHSNPDEGRVPVVRITDSGDSK